MMRKLRTKLPTKQTIWRYIRLHYGSLYFYGFGAFALLVSIFAGSLYLRGDVVFKPEFIGFMVFVCFGWVSWSVFSQTADRLHKNESDKAQSNTQQQSKREVE